ncbi:MAG: hypothetical protein AAGN64_14965 [Bacteroidota bacterium]
MLSYEGVEFELSYTVMHWLRGWAMSGAQDTSVQDVPTIARLDAMFTYLENAMGWDARELKPETIEWYESHGVPARRPMPEQFAPHYPFFEVAQETTDEE